MSSSRRKKSSPKRILALPDLEQAKSAVPNSLTSVSGQRTDDHAINHFVEWALLRVAPGIQSHRGAEIPHSLAYRPQLTEAPLSAFVAASEAGDAPITVIASTQEKFSTRSFAAPRQSGN